MFYVLQPEIISEHHQARIDAYTADGTRYGEAPRCEACGKFIGMKPWLPPFRVDIETWGHQFGDLGFPSVSGNLLASLRFKELWEREELTGLAGFEPVEVVKITRRRKIKGDPPPYFKTAIVLGRAEVDYAASGFEIEEPPTCPVCKKGNIVRRWNSIILEPGTWSGEDIFRARWTSEFLVTEKFKHFCEENAITNTIFIPAEEFGGDFYPWEKKSVSR